MSVACSGKDIKTEWKKEATAFWKRVSLLGTPSGDRVTPDLLFTLAKSAKDSGFFYNDVIESVAASTPEVNVRGWAAVLKALVSDGVADMKQPSSSSVGSKQSEEYHETVRGCVWDLRHISNKKITDALFRNLSIMIIQDEFFSTKDEMTVSVKIRECVFVVNCNHIGEVVICIPVYSSVRKYVGELLILLTFEDCSCNIDKVLDMLTSNPEDCCKFKLSKPYYRHFHRNREQLVRYSSTVDMEVFIKKVFTDQHRITKVFYGMPENCSWQKSSDNMFLVCEATEGDGVERCEIVFQDSKGTNFVDSLIPVNKQSSAEVLLNCFRNPFAENECYRSIPTEDETKQKED